MKKILMLACISLISSTLFGCATGTSVCDSTSWSHAIVSGIPLVGPATGVSCLGIGVADVTSSVIERNKSAEPTEKTFHASPAVEADLANTPGTLDLVISAQDRYKNRDFGSTTDREQTALIGRYPRGGKVILITNQEKYWLVAYESEQVAFKKP